MADQSVIDFSALTLNPEEARESNDLVFEKVFASPELEEIHSIMTGIEMDKFIPILGKFGLLGKLNPDDCSQNSESDQIPVSQKEWNPKLISYQLIHCQNKIPDLLKFWKKSRIAAGTWEDVDNEMVAFIEDRAEDATKKGIIRIAEFADTDATAVGAGYGSETLTVGTDPDYFNMNDGMWKQYFTDQALPTPKGFRHVVAENALSTTALQLDLAADAAISAMRALYEGISPEAFEGDLKFQMTRSFFNNWQTFLEDKSLAFTLTQAETKSGTDGWSYRGIPIVVRKDWDRIIKTYYDNGTKLDNPHRMTLSTLENVPIGTSDTESFKTFSSKFIDNGTTEQHYLKSAYKIDCKILLEEETAVAY